MTPDNREEQVREAIAVFDKSAERTRPNAQTAAWATIRAHIEALEANDRRYRWLRDESPLTWSVQQYVDSELKARHLFGDEIDAAIDSAMQGEEVRKLRVLQCPECPTSVETSQTGEVDCLRCDATMQADPTAKVAKPSGVRIVPEEPQP